MELSEYIATFDRLSKIVGSQAARNIVDQMDEERTKAAKKEAKRLAKEERTRELIRQELGLA